ncbi:MAG: carbon starvation protein A, partial [Candidatus Omnitrophica bacterium]|nr:carbon starvation protein A [Candidatus Omnitrophota bacterium]
CLAGLVFLGNILPVNNSLNIWLLILFIYCYFASILPVNVLLQPRDYLSSFLLFFGIGCGYLGLILSPPRIDMPGYHSWASGEGYLWPALFITVACGAVSGFHTLVASGTTSKQIASERHIKRIGYGAMVCEALLALIAIVSVAALFHKKEDFALILKSATPIGLFGRGYGLITSSILGNSGKVVAIVILNAFIITTLDTATRISRYLIEELFKVKNRYFSSFIIVILGASLAFSGKWNKIWPAFGASNQLVAALALLVLSCWLLAKKKSARFTLWPAFFMIITTIASLLFQVVKYFINKDIMLFTVSVLLVILAGVMLYEVIPIILIRRKRHA